MKVCHHDKTQKFEHGATCTAFEYPINDKDINLALIELDGRYPTEGRAVNEICKELAYVLSGQGSVEVEGEVIELTAGDVVLIEPGEKYFWQGRMKLLMPCTPAWTAEQYRQVN